MKKRYLMLVMSLVLILNVANAYSSYTINARESFIQLSEKLLPTNKIEEDFYETRIPKEY